MILRKLIDWLSVALLKGYEKQLRYELISIENILGYSSIDEHGDIEFYQELHISICEKLDAIRKTRKHIEENTLI